MGCWTLHKALDADEVVNNLFSVLSVSSAVNSAELGFDAQKNRPRSCDARAVGFSGNLIWFLRGRPGRLRGVPRGRGMVSSSHS
jgi:hypothetical protein